MPGSLNSFADKLSKTISVIFHPLLLPLYGLLIIFSAPTLFGFMPLVQKKVLVMILLINNILLPLSLIPYFKWRGIITTWTMENRTERIIPLAITSFFYFITLYIVLRFAIPVFIKAFILSTALLSFTVTVINFWWKVSLHSVGAGAMTAVILILSFTMHTPLTVFLLCAIMVSGLVLSSRLWLNTHNPAEVWLGYLLGTGGMSALLVIF